MENKQLLDEYDKMFELPAWKDLVEDFRVRRDSLGPTLLQPQSDEKHLYRAQGLNVAYNYIIGLKDMMDAVRKEMEHEQANPI